MTTVIRTLLYLYTGTLRVDTILFSIFFPRRVDNIHPSIRPRNDKSYHPRYNMYSFSVYIPTLYRRVFRNGVIQFFSFFTSLYTLQHITVLENRAIPREKCWNNLLYFIVYSINDHD